MPNNDRSDAFSVRGRSDDEEPRPDPRREMKAMEQTVEREMAWSEAQDTGGVEHQGPGEHVPAERQGVVPQPAPDAPGGYEPP
jgi:hypothetical protein